MTNLESTDGGCFLINGAMIALDAATFSFDDDNISISVGYPDQRPNFQKYDQVSGDGTPFASVEEAKDWISENCLKKKASDVDPGAATWGEITGTLSDQADLQAALNAKANTATTVTGTGALTGGGSLAANRTIDASTATKASLVKAESAVQPAVLTNATLLAKNSSGTITPLAFTSDPTLNTIAYRDANGNFKSGTAIADTDVVNLQGLNAATKSKAAIVALTALDPAADLPTAVTAINQIIAALKA